MVQHCIGAKEREKKPSRIPLHRGRPIIRSSSFADLAGPALAPSLHRPHPHRVASPSPQAGSRPVTHPPQVRNHRNRPTATEEEEIPYTDRERRGEAREEEEQQSAAMGFIMEFAENLILRLMEDPEKRDEAQREHVYRMKERCERTKAAWSLPLRPYGFWTFDRFNSQLSWDPQISQAPGRRDPYDDLLHRHENPTPPPPPSSSS